MPCHVVQHGRCWHGPRHVLTAVAGDIPDFLRELAARLADSAQADEVVGEFERRVRRYCGEHGIPRSVFLGRVVGPDEPLWLPADVESALRYQTEQDALCPGCRQPRRESFDTSHRYAAELHICQGCAPMQKASWTAEKNRAKNAPPRFGAYYSVKKLE